jgi:hypothetical protein
VGQVLVVGLAGHCAQPFALALGYQVLEEGAVCGIGLDLFGASGDLPLEEGDNRAESVGTGEFCSEMVLEGGGEAPILAMGFNDVDDTCDEGVLLVLVILIVPGQPRQSLAESLVVPDLDLAVLAVAHHAVSGVIAESVGPLQSTVADEAVLEQAHGLLVLQVFGVAQPGLDALGVDLVGDERGAHRPG